MRSRCVRGPMPEGVWGTSTIAALKPRACSTFIATSEESAIAENSSAKSRQKRSRSLRWLK